MITNLKNLLLNSKGSIASFNTVDLEMAKGCILAAEELNINRVWNIRGFATQLKSFSELMQDSASSFALRFSNQMHRNRNNNITVHIQTKKINMRIHLFNRMLNKGL